MNISDVDFLYLDNIPFRLEKDVVSNVNYFNIAGECVTISYTSNSGRKTHIIGSPPILRIDCDIGDTKAGRGDKDVLKILDRKLYSA
jgi:hypothetical protein